MANMNRLRAQMLIGALVLVCVPLSAQPPHSCTGCKYPMPGQLHCSNPYIHCDQYVPVMYCGQSTGNWRWCDAYAGYVICCGLDYPSAGDGGACTTPPCTKSASLVRAVAPGEFRPPALEACTEAKPSDAPAVSQPSTKSPSKPTRPELSLDATETKRTTTGAQGGMHDDH